MRHFDFDDWLQRWWEQARGHALIALDPSGTIVAWGGDAEVLFGYKSHEVIGHQCNLLFTPEDVEAGAPTKEMQIADSGSPAEDDRWMRRRDGSRFWATGILHAVREDDGALIGYSKILRDRTDLKGQLEGLKRDVRQLAGTDGRKNRFITTLAHELRNPLSALGMAAEILTLNPNDVESREFAIQAIKRQVQFSTRLIEDLLDVTRIKQGKLRINPQLLNLIEVIHRAVDAVSALASEKRQTLHVILDGGAVSVMGDADRLQQVFVNLIQNAVKYTQEGGNVWVKLLLDGKEAAVKIEDNGVGISAKLLPKIFDLFAQAETSEEHAAGGLGIGLSVVKDLVRLHNGSVQVRSDGLTHGSEFIVRLPLAGPSEARPDDPRRQD